MKTTFYKIQCVTNLHVGSGDVNYSVVDNQVEKDPTNNMPMIHASGLKGALRDMIKKQDETLAKKIFGSSGNRDETKAGTHKFLDAMMIARPMRVSGSDEIASIPVTTIDILNNLIALLDTFGCNSYGIQPISSIDFGGASFLATIDEIKVEGEETGVLPAEIVTELKKIEEILGTEFAIAASFDGYDLPVIARNHLEAGISCNLWYEEFVPHGSIFCFAVMVPENLPADEALNIPDIIQIGGNATIGYGISKVTKLVEVNKL